MRHMVRILVGTMLEVGVAGAAQRSSRSCYVAPPGKARAETAPAHGLYLASVRY